MKTFDPSSSPTSTLHPVFPNFSPPFPPTHLESFGVDGKNVFPPTCTKNSQTRHSAAGGFVSGANFWQVTSDVAMSAFLMCKIAATRSCCCHAEMSIFQKDFSLWRSCNYRSLFFCWVSIAYSVILFARVCYGTVKYICLQIGCHWIMTLDNAQNKVLSLCTQENHKAKCYQISEQEPGTKYYLKIINKSLLLTGLLIVIYKKE